MAGVDRDADARYAAFISFKDGDDSEFAEALQRELQRFAKPWNKLRAIRVFRYDASLPASPSLWASIEEALSESRWLILLASPAAGRSIWVGREVAWWLQNRDGARRTLLVLTEGELSWDEVERDFHPTRSTALHPALRGVFADEPRWVDARWTRGVNALDMRDPRMQQVVIDIAAAVRGLEKDALAGDAVREHRKTRRLVRSAVALLSLLLAMAIIAGALAWGQRNAALDALRVSESRQLAALAQQHSERDIGLAALLALTAHQVDQNGQTDAALAQAALGGALLSRIGQFSDDVSAVAMNTNPDITIAGLRSGEVALWDTSNAAARVLGSIQSGIASVAASGDGALVLATTETGAYLLNSGSFDDVTLPESMSAGSPQLVVAMTRDGSRAWVGSADFERGFGLCEVDIPTLKCAPITAPFLNDWRGGLRLMVSDSGVLTLFEPTYGSWARVDIESMSELSSGSYGGFGTYQAHPALSPDGSWLGVATHDTASRVEMWPATATESARGIRDTGDVRTVFTGLTPRTASFAIAPGGDAIAISYDGGVSLIQDVAQSPDNPVVVELTGAEDVSQLFFLGDGLALVGIRGDRILRWDIAQQNRVAVGSFEITLSGGCAACGPPVLAVAPDGSKVLAITPNDANAAIVDTLSGEVTTLADESAFAAGYQFAQPVWTDDLRLVLPVTGVPGSIGPTTVPGFPGAADVVSWSRSVEDDNSIAIATTPDGDVITVDADGVIREYRAADGYISHQRRIEGGTDVWLARASFNPEGTILAALRQDTVDPTVTELLIADTNRGSTSVLAAGAYVGLAWDQEGLILQRSDGALELRRGDNLQIDRELSANGATLTAADSSGRTHLIALQSPDNSLQLMNTSTGQLVATFPSQSGGLYDRSSVAFTSSAGHLVVLNEPVGSPSKARLTIYDFSAERLEDAACRIAWTDLGAAKWKEVAPGITRPEVC